MGFRQYYAVLVDHITNILLLIKKYKRNKIFTNKKRVPLKYTTSFIYLFIYLFIFFISIYPLGVSIYIFILFLIIFFFKKSTMYKKTRI